MKGPGVFVITLTGAFFCWMIKGFKGKFDDEMTGMNESSFKEIRNVVVGFVILTSLAYLLFSK
jgi:hypothetical protein